jgi:hypothetical protein
MPKIRLVFYLIGSTGLCHSDVPEIYNRALQKLPLLMAAGVHRHQAMR